MSVNDLEANPGSINQNTDDDATLDEEEKGESKFGARTLDGEDLL